MRRVVRKPERITAALGWVSEKLQLGLQRGPVVLEIKRETRSLEQNAKMWAMLRDISDQVVWHGMHLSSSDWKEMFSASLKQQRSAPSIDGHGFVILGASTSRMTKAELSDLIELIQAFGAENEVKFTAKDEP